MRLAFVISSTIGFLLFLPMGLFAAGPLNIGAGVFAGVIGGIIGGLLVVPFYFVLRKDHKQELVDKAEPIRVEPSAIVTGLWRLDRHLVFDPETATFPQRCIFTNKVVKVLRPFTIGHLKGKSFVEVALVGAKKRVEYLPVSKEWLRNRQRISKAVQWIAITVAFAGIVASIVGWFLTGNEKLFSLLLSLSVIGFLIGLALPRIADFGDRQEIYFANFLEDGRIIIQDPHPEFIAGLPELKAGFFHGVMGIEQIRESE